jgi:hypothetical protein
MIDYKLTIFLKIDELYSVLSFVQDPAVESFFTTLLRVIKYDMLIINQYSCSKQEGPPVYHPKKNKLRNEAIAECSNETSRLPVPDVVSARRKSSGHIFRELGSHHHSDGNEPRQSTLETQVRPSSISNVLSLVRSRRDSSTHMMR